MSRSTQAIILVVALLAGPAVLADDQSEPALGSLRAKRVARLAVSADGGTIVALELDGGVRVRGSDGRWVPKWNTPVTYSESAAIDATGRVLIVSGRGKGGRRSAVHRLDDGVDLCEVHSDGTASGALATLADVAGRAIALSDAGDCIASMSGPACVEFREPATGRITGAMRLVGLSGRLLVAGFESAQRDVYLYGERGTICRADHKTGRSIWMRQVSIARRPDAPVDADDDDTVTAAIGDLVICSTIQRVAVRALKRFTGDSLTREDIVILDAENGNEVWRRSLGDSERVTVIPPKGLVVTYSASAATALRVVDGKVAEYPGWDLSRATCVSFARGTGTAWAGLTDGSIVQLTDAQQASDAVRGTAPPARR